MFVMMIMSVSPCIKREMSVNSKYFPNKSIHGNRREKGEMSHIMKLYEYPYTNKDIEAPSDNYEVHFDQSKSNDLHEYCHSYCRPCLTVISLSVLNQVRLKRIVF